MLKYRIQVLTTLQLVKIFLINVYNSNLIKIDTKTFIIIDKEILSAFYYECRMHIRLK
jgi:hypothetical protein